MADFAAGVKRAGAAGSRAPCARGSVTWGQPDKRAAIRMVKGALLVRGEPRPCSRRPLRARGPRESSTALRRQSGQARQERVRWARRADTEVAMISFEASARSSSSASLAATMVSSPGWRLQGSMRK